MSSTFIKGCLSVSALFLVLCLGAQDTLRVKQDTYFKNGIYMSLAGFQQNTPDLSWTEVDAEAFVDEQAGLVHFSEIITINSGRVYPIPLESIYGVSIEGKFYINLEQTNNQVRLSEVGKEPYRFVRLQAIGNLCYFSYLGYLKERVPISVYHPRTGIKMQTNYIENWRQVVVKKILKFESGQFYPYDYRTFMALIEDDLSLWATLKDLPEIDARQKMYKSLFIYNDRNPVFFKPLR